MTQSPNGFSTQYIFWRCHNCRISCFVCPALPSSLTLRFNVNGWYLLYLCVHSATVSYWSDTEQPQYSIHICKLHDDWLLCVCKLSSYWSDPERRLEPVVTWAQGSRLTRWPPSWTAPSSTAAPRRSRRSSDCSQVSFIENTLLKKIKMWKIS